ncbi:GntR family transcriptional regulator [Labrys monachus]|uniref:DNA-binding GntR family transcriptional regulator n=1 Tax=Labrys monachus TaxID=217067 RepID=A0ABU0FMI3_9HYPH|nr:GntR family transcriptional regulator [Labrys monachus]MDQ0395686.1 DNA-binding GntR family transcriptional regulator [Labrys monachus]
MDDLQITHLSGRIWQGGVPREDLVGRVSNALREQIQSGALPHGTRLRGEAELARQLNISRPTLREATRILARDGLLDIRHGVGTFVTDPSRHVSSALDTMRSMSALIRSFGGEPRVRDMTFRMVPAEGGVAEALGVAKDTPVAQICRVRLMDERPLAVAYEYIRLVDPAREFALVRRFDGSSIYRFMSEQLARPLARSEMSVTAVSAGKTFAALLDLKPRSPLLLMREAHFDIEGRRSLYSVNYHNSDVIDFTLVRAGMKS